MSASGVWIILKRVDLSRLPTSQRYKPHRERWKRYDKLQPGHSVQLDVKFIEPIRCLRKKHYQFTAIDDCTRLRVLKIQTDNGDEFQAGFHWHLPDRGIRHVYIRPSTPRLNGNERSHRIDDEEFYRMLAGVVIDDAQLFNTKLAEWRTVGG